MIRTMTESSVMFGITLEDYSAPRFEGKTALYCGSREELNQFLNSLTQKEWAQARYAQLLKGFFDSDKKSYQLFDKEYPTSHRLRLLYSQEEFLKDCIWEYNTSDGSIYHLFANQLIISRVIAKDSEYIYRFIRARITGLEVNIQGQGWVEMKDQFQGFPGVYRYEKNQHVMNFHICNKIYEEYDEKLALREVKEFDADEELEYITKDLLGEGIM